MSTNIFNDRMHSGRIVHANHFGHPVLVETTPIQLAKIPIAEEELHQSILLHPRYAPKTGSNLIEVKGLKRGRTIEILLDKPIVIDGNEYTVLSFKGVGADANTEMRIHPTKWYGNSDYPDTWVDRKDADRYDRLWGALRQDHGKEEFDSKELPNLGIPMTPHLALNDVPEELARRIANVEGWREILPICQLVRGMNTNLRLADFVDVYRIISEVRADTVQMAEIDSKVVLGQLVLFGQAQMIKSMGSIKENRLIDGLFTDAENYSIAQLDIHSSIEFLISVIKQSVWMVKDGREYLRIVEQKTGIPISGISIDSGFAIYDSLYDILSGLIAKRDGFAQAGG